MRSLILLSALSVVALGGSLTSQAISSAFAGSYSIRSLGPVPGVPTPYGGITFKYDDPDVLLIGGLANQPGAAIYEIRVARDLVGNITGFQGTASVLASAPNIDGGLQYGPQNVLFFTQYPLNGLGQIKVGSTTPDKLISLTNVPGFVGSSTGTSSKTSSTNRSGGKQDKLPSTIKFRVKLTNACLEPTNVSSPMSAKELIKTLAVAASPSFTSAYDWLPLRNSNS